MHDGLMVSLMTICLLNFSLATAHTDILGLVHYGPNIATRRSLEVVSYQSILLVLCSKFLKLQHLIKLSLAGLPTAASFLHLIIHL